ncbi:MAG: NUDIX domain-containing protein [Chloroflexota bacterium]|nr:NUDIX domain-containing protein [Chloroflexota bacterium]
MPKPSAGLLLYRRRGDSVEVLLAHPGGPLWAKRDAGVWSVPKGEIETGEKPFDVARREFHEETGHKPPAGECLSLGEIRQKSGKLVVAWACEGDLDPTTSESNTFPLEWPPGSGNWIDVPEIDRVEWFAPDEARRRLNPAQAEFVDRLLAMLADREPRPPLRSTP